MDTEAQRYWQQGLNQPEISKESSKRQPAFDYKNLDHTSFDSNNWNDIMLHPLREFLDGLSFVVPKNGTSFEKENGWEEIDSPIETIYHKELDVTISLVYADDQSTFIIQPADKESTIFVSWYKSRGRTEQILNQELAPVTLDELNNIYDALCLKDPFRTLYFP